MLYQIVSLLLEVAAVLVAGTCLLRLYMQYQGVSMSARAGNPVGPFIFSVTNWLVLPLRRVVPSVGRWDLASLLGAFLVELARYLILWLLSGMELSLLSLLVLAAFGVVQMGISGLTGLVIVFAILSWVPTQGFAAELLQRMVSPLLAPIRRVLPLVGGMDLSPLALLLLLQIGGIVLRNVQASVMYLL